MNLASSFYTNVVEYKGKLLIRGVNNGQSYLSRINYSPKLYLPTKEESKYKTLDGTNLKEKRFDSISKQNISIVSTAQYQSIKSLV